MNSQISSRLIKTPSEAFVEKLTLLAFVVVFFAFVYLFFEIVFLIFGALVIASLISLLARPLQNRLGLRRWVAVLIAILILAGFIGVAGYLFGTRLAFDIQNVVSRMTSAQNQIHNELQRSEFGKFFMSQLGGATIPVGQIATRAFSISTTIIAGVVVAVMAGIYIAAEPSIYLNGFLMLFPDEKRSYAGDTAKAVGDGLFLWLEGQFISMILIGVLSMLATWAIGLPSPVALGLIAGVTEFIPYVGPIIAAIPALLVAATQNTSDVLWTLIAYLFIHLSEGNLIAPLIQRQLVYVPPAIMLLGIAAITIIFGGVAVIFAAPMVVVLFVLISKLYIRDSLGEKTSLPGEKSEHEHAGGA